MSHAESIHQTAVVFFCHGSRDPHWRVPFDQILQSFRSHYPGVRAELAFLELMAPDLPSTIDDLCRAGSRRIRVIPVFLAPGAHTRRDLPALLDAARQRWPDLRVDAGETLTEAPVLRQAIIDWAATQATFGSGHSNEEPPREGAPTAG